jgi:uncharacterized membrane protein YciS (DUF1049 family)
VKRSIRRSLCAAMLVLQAVVLFLAGVVTIGLTDLGAATSLIGGLGLAVLCVTVAGMLGRPFGYAAGWLVQALSIGLGLVVTAMFFLGLVFAALWATAYFLGARIDRERDERAVLEQEWQAQHGTGPVTDS